MHISDKVRSPFLIICFALLQLTQILAFLGLYPDRHETTHEITDQTGIFNGSVETTIFKHLKFKYASAEYGQKRTAGKHETHTQCNVEEGKGLTEWKEK
jgi:hypothetical protein